MVAQRRRTITSVDFKRLCFLVVIVCPVFSKELRGKQCLKEAGPAGYKWSRGLLPRRRIKNVLGVRHHMELAADPIFSGDFANKILLSLVPRLG